MRKIIFKAKKIMKYPEFKEIETQLDNINNFFIESIRVYPHEITTNKIEIDINFQLNKIK